MLLLGYFVTTSLTFVIVLVVKRGRCAIKHAKLAVYTAVPRTGWNVIEALIYRSCVSDNTCFTTLEYYIQCSWYIKIMMSGKGYTEDIPAFLYLYSTNNYLFTTHGVSVDYNVSYNWILQYKYTSIVVLIWLLKNLFYLHDITI